jgi:hypothetical protein
MASKASKNKLKELQEFYNELQERKTNYYAGLTSKHSRR